MEGDTERLGQRHFRDTARNTRDTVRNTLEKRLEKNNRDVARDTIETHTDICCSSLTHPHRETLLETL